MFEPLEIVFRVRSPVAVGHPWLHFDGIVAHVVTRLVLGEDYYVLPSKDPLGAAGEKAREVGLKWPIEIVYNPETRDHFSCASVAFFEHDNWHVATIYKRWHEAGVHIVNARRIRVGSGKFRAWAIELPYRPAGRVRFYAKAEKKRLEELLEHLPALGKKSAIGFGEVIEYDVSSCDRDNSIVDSHGLATRPIPVWAVERASETMLLAYKPPYWDRRNVGECAPPGARVKLRRGLKHE